MSIRDFCAFWYILVLFVANLVYFPPIGLLHQEKSGNPDARCKTAICNNQVREMYGSNYQYVHQRTCKISQTDFFHPSLQQRAKIVCRCFDEAINFSFVAELCQRPVLNALGRRR
jgi:hypothetical protein